jgi:uncharacterized membrane protein (DUF373 family)
MTVGEEMIRFAEKFEEWIAYGLLGLMAVIVLSATLEVGYEVAVNIFTPPGYFIGVEDLFPLFGLLLMVMIGLELMGSVQLYLEKREFHAESMLLVALTAVTRKIVTMDAKTLDPMMIFAVGFMVIALAVGYYFISRRRSDDSA